jgi:dihydrolipoamide dehydrogenase
MLSRERGGMYDLIVIGAGPGGYEAAALAGRRGRKTALIEKEYIGGTCLNVGCIPTKTLLRSSRLFEECRKGSAYGVEIPSVRLNLAAVMQRKNRIVATLTRGVESLLKRSGVEVIRGHARLSSKHSVQVGKDTYQAKNILIATGSRPAIPPITGIDSKKVLDSTGILELAELPGKIAIMGGGYVGLEFAGFFAATGVDVTVIEMLPRIAAGMDSDISSRLQQALKKSGIKFKMSHKVTAVENGIVQCEDSSGARASVSADCILNATGRLPVVDGLDLGAVGIDFDRRGIKTSDEGKTNVPGIWACGDVTGRRLLAHAATREGIVAVNTMFGKKDRVRYETVPAVIYTHPEVASVGRTEEELKALGIEYKKLMVPMAVAGRFLVENEEATGIMKVLVGTRYHEILGVHAVGNLSSEFIVAAAQMIESEMCVEDVVNVVFPHPTVSEALKQAILELAAD